MIKVTQTEKYDSDIIVCKGKLVFIWGDCRKEEFYKYGIISHDGTQCAKPIVISEIEEICTGDNVLDNVNRIWINMESCFVNAAKNNKEKSYKILALPEQLSPKHLQDILDGRLKDSDEVFIECDSNIGQLGSIDDTLDSWVKLTDNYITLFHTSTLQESIEELNKTISKPPKYTEEQVVNLMNAYTNRLTAKSHAEIWETEKWFKENSNKIIKT